MKIKTNIIIDFFKKCKMESEHAINDWLMDFKEDGVHIAAACPSKSTMVISHLSNKAFTEYEAVGGIGLNDLDKIIHVFGRFDKEVSIDKKGNLLTISGENKSVGTELISEKFFSETKIPDLEYEEKFDIEASKLKEIFKDVLMNKDSVITIKTEEGIVKFGNTGKYKFTNIVEAPGCKGGVKVKLGMPFINAANNLTDKLTIKLKSDYPIYITEKTDNSEINIIVAPRVEED